MVLDINELISVTGPDINEYVTFMCISKLHRALSLNTSPSQEPLIACRKFTNCLAVKKICNLLCFLVFFVTSVTALSTSYSPSHTLLLSLCRDYIVAIVLQTTSPLKYTLKDFATQINTF